MTLKSMIIKLKTTVLYMYLLIITQSVCGCVHVQDFNIIVTWSLLVCACVCVCVCVFMYGQRLSRVG